MSEHDQQAAVIQWANAQACSVPELRLLFAIPNGGGRGKSFITKSGHKYPPLEAVKLKKEGVRPGVPDLCLPVARNGYNALYIEMKDTHAKLSTDQISWKAALCQQGNYVVTCWSATEAIQELKNYLHLR